jgi:hypothetical protein
MGSWTDDTGVNLRILHNSERRTFFSFVSFSTCQFPCEYFSSLIFFLKLAQKSVLRKGARCILEVGSTHRMDMTRWIDKEPEIHILSKSDRQINYSWLNNQLTNSTDLSPSSKAASQNYPTFYVTIRFTAVFTKPLHWSQSGARFQTIHPSLRLYVTFWKRLFLYGEDLLAPHTTPELKDNPFSADHDCLFSIFPTTLHIQRRYQLSAVIPWWQGVYLTWMKCA